MPDFSGSFTWICAHAPLPQCNIFFTQLWNRSPPPLTRLFPDSSAFYDLYNVSSRSLPDDPPVLAAWADSGTGLAAGCEIARVGRRGSQGDIALIVLSALSVLVKLVLMWRAHRREAAVGRQELKALFGIYAVHCIFQILTMASLFQQSSEVLSILSAIHVAIIPALFFVLFWNGVVAIQAIEDGTLASLAPLIIASILLFAPTLYIALDTSHSWSTAFRLDGETRAVALFVLTLVWPAAASVLFILLMLYVCIRKLREAKPALLFLLAFAIFAGGQVILFLASQSLCTASGRKINGAFLAAFLDTLALSVVYLAWVIITEEYWPEDSQVYYPVYV